MCSLFGYEGSSKFRSAVLRQQVPNSLIMDAVQRRINCVVTLIAVAGVSGYLASASSRGAGISDRLLRLKHLALRLESRDVTRYNLETPKYWDNKLDIVRSSYTIFHNDLTNFVNALPSKFRDDAPMGLSKVTIIPAVFPVNDPALVNGNVDKVIQEWFNLRNITNTLLDNVERFLKPEGIVWLKGQRSTLSMDMIDMDISVLSLRFSGITYNPNDFVILSSGIGGVNPGTADAVKKLEDIKRRVAVYNLLKTLEGNK